MSYVVLARKWRPQSFEDLVGQEHVSITVGNAIAQNRVAHAFLFTGVRGVGKTTSARILAKALNCAKGPSPKPCQECPQCREITAGNDVDVLEIDGASYNGVDEVRRLQESLPYRPQRDRFKIYIVDEVHMLSNAAWNAFLKTLEEPPPHVKFIFATTEVHKVPVTILSRCQRYDFKLIGAQGIASRLRFVLEKEGIAADDAALSVLAREAAGSMRDAMSLLDQVIAWVGVEGDRLTAEGVAKVLGVAGHEVLYKLSEAAITGDAATAVRILGELANQGYDLPHVARDFLAHLRDLVITKVADAPGSLLDLAEDEIKDLARLAERADVDDLTRLHQGFSRAFDDIVRSGQPRAAFEMALVRLARRPPLLPIDDLLRRLGALERRLSSGAPAAPARGGGERGGGPEPSRGGFQAPTAPAVPRRPGGVAMSQPTPRDPAPTRGGAETKLPAPDPEPPAPTPAIVAPRAPEKPPTLPAPPARPMAPEPSAPPPNIDLEPWRSVLSVLRSKRPALASVFEHAALLAFGQERVTVGFETNSFLAGQASEVSAVELLSSVIDGHFGRRVPLTFETISTKLPQVTVAAVEMNERKVRLDAARRAVSTHPLVTAAIELLGAELRDVRLAEGEV